MAKVIGFDDGGFRRAVKAIQRVEETPRNSREDYWPDTGADDGTFDDYVLVTGTSNDDGWYPGVTQIRAADTDVWEDITGDTVYIRGINNEDLSIDTRYKGTIVGEYDDAVAYEALGSGAGLTVTEFDGSPVVNSVNRIVLDQSTGIYLANALTVSGATSTFPIQITTTTPHGFSSGMRPTITGVTGNTAANVSGVSITVINSTTFSLDGIAANGVYTGGGQVTLPGEARIAINVSTPSSQTSYPWTRAKSTLGFPSAGQADPNGVSFKYNPVPDQEYTDLHPGCMMRTQRSWAFVGILPGGSIYALPYMWHKPTHLTCIGQVLNVSGGGNLALCHIGIYDNLVPGSLNYFYPGSLLAGGLVSTQPDDQIHVGGPSVIVVKLLSISVDVESDRIYWFVTYVPQNSAGMIGVSEIDLEPIYGLRLSANSNGVVAGSWSAGVGVWVQGYANGFLPQTFPKQQLPFQTIDMMPASFSNFYDMRPVVVYRKGN